MEHPMKTVCEADRCTGCMACVDACPQGAIDIRDGLAAYNAVICAERCCECGACRRVCQVNHPVAAVAPIRWQQGWAENTETRRNGSSGGVATAVAAAFIRDGGAVCGCALQNGVFSFALIQSQDALLPLAGSKYVKSSPAGLYRQIAERLRGGQKVLFIGLPCQVAGLKRFIEAGLQTQLYTADLICHGTPAPGLLDMFLAQYGLRLERVRSITFRDKAKMRISADGRQLAAGGACDRYSIAFLEGLTYTENCYHCAYAKSERVADLTLGDSWGSELPASEARAGISLLLCQTEKGDALLARAGLHLEPVDPQKAIAGNRQLAHPSAKPAARARFLRGIEKGVRFNRMALRCLPKQCLRQDAKAALIRLKLLRRG